MRRGRPLRHISEKRLARLAERERAVDEAFYRHHHRCVLATMVPEVPCRGKLDAHEIMPRSAWAEGIYDVDNIVPVCRAHHDWIDAHEPEAHAYGVHAYSWEREGP